MKTIRGDRDKGSRTQNSDSQKETFKIKQEAELRHTEPQSRLQQNRKQKPKQQRTPITIKRTFNLKPFATERRNEKDPQRIYQTNSPLKERERWRHFLKRTIIMPRTTNVFKPATVLLVMGVPKIKSSQIVPGPSGNICNNHLKQKQCDPLKVQLSKLLVSVCLRSAII